MVYNVPFSEDERQSIKLQIQSSLYGYLGILLEERERFEEEWLTEMRRKRSDEPGPSSMWRVCFRFLFSIQLARLIVTASNYHKFHKEYVDAFLLFLVSSRKGKPKSRL